MAEPTDIPSAADFGEATERSPQAGVPDKARSPAADAGIDAAPQPQPIPEGARTLVDIHDPAAREYWSDRFNVTHAQLEEAVSAVGSDAHAVATYLRGQGSGD